MCNSFCLQPKHTYYRIRSSEWRFLCATGNRTLAFEYKRYGRRTLATARLFVLTYRPTNVIVGCCIYPIEFSSQRSSSFRWHITSVTHVLWLNGKRTSGFIISLVKSGFATKTMKWLLQAQTKRGRKRLSTEHSFVIWARQNIPQNLPVASRIRTALDLYRCRHIWRFSTSDD